MSTTKRKRYAEGTGVPVQRTRDELERVLESHGATATQVSRDAATRQAVVIFRLEERLIRLKIKVDASDIPNAKMERWLTKDDRVSFPQGWPGWGATRRQDWFIKQLEQREREAWRRILLITKAKLEVVADAESTIEREFLADIMLPDGTTVHEALAPKLAQSYTDGSMPPLLLSGRTT